MKPRLPRSDTCNIPSREVGRTLLHNPRPCNPRNRQGLDVSSNFLSVVWTRARSGAVSFAHRPRTSPSRGLAEWMLGRVFRCPVRSTAGYHRRSPGRLGGSELRTLAPWQDFAVSESLKAPRSPSGFPGKIRLVRMAWIPGYRARRRGGPGRPARREGPICSRSGLFASKGPTRDRVTAELSPRTRSSVRGGWGLGCRAHPASDGAPGRGECLPTMSGFGTPCPSGTPAGARRRTFCLAPQRGRANVIMKVASGFQRDHRRGGSRE